MDHQSLERDLFDWKEWDEGDVMCISFHDITLKQDIGPFKKGDNFPWANIDFRSATLEIGISDTEFKSFKLNLVFENGKD